MNQKHPLLVAIDPGASGGFAHTHKNGEVEAVPMPEREEEICALLKWYSDNGYKFYMEKVGGYIPDKDGEGQPGSRMFVFGEGYGFIRGVLLCCGNPPVLVVPQRWQRGFPRFKEKRDRKNAFKAHAQKVFPRLTVTLATADALCLLHYAQAQESGRFAPPVKSLPVGARLLPAVVAIPQNETIVPRRTKANKPPLPAKVGTWTP
jgi:hypothetical protein